MNLTRKKQDERIKTGTIGILGSALGENHALVNKVGSCSTKLQPVHPETEQKEPGYCKQYLICNTCNKLRYRLAKSIFLAGHRKNEPLYSVTIVPASAFSRHDLYDVIEAFKKMETIALRHFDSFLGSKEIKSSVVAHDGNSIWPHLHLIATGLKDNNLEEAEGEFKLLYREMPIKEWERTIQHHFKPLVFSWFPEKESKSNIPVFDNWKLEETQAKDTKWIIDHFDVFLGDPVKIGQITCYGDFNFGNIYRPKNRKLLEFMNSRDLDRIRTKSSNGDKRKKTKDPSLSKQKWFTKVAVYLFHLLDNPDKKQNAIHLARLSESKQRSLQRELRKYQAFILPLVVKK